MNLNALASMFSPKSLAAPPINSTQSTHSVQASKDNKANSVSHGQSHKTQRAAVEIHISSKANTLASIDNQQAPTLENIQTLLHEIKSSLNHFFDANGFTASGNVKNDAFSFRLDSQFTSLSITGGGKEGQDFASLFTQQADFDKPFKMLAALSEAHLRSHGKAQSDASRSQSPVNSLFASISAAMQGPEQANTFSFEYSYSRLSLEVNGNTWQSSDDSIATTKATPVSKKPNAQINTAVA